MPRTTEAIVADHNIAGRYIREPWLITGSNELGEFTTAADSNLGGGPDMAGTFSFGEYLIPPGGYTCISPRCSLVGVVISITVGVDSSCIGVSVPIPIGNVGG